MQKGQEERDYNAERDISDYLTMAYCLDNDIPVMGFCRGMQMLSVVSGAEVIQDVPAYFAELGLEYNDEHNNRKASPTRGSCSTTCAGITARTATP